MKRGWLLTVVLVGAGVVLGAQARNALNLLVNGPDANGNLPIGLAAYGGVGGPARSLANLPLKQDALGNLAVTIASGNGVALAGLGTPLIVADGRLTGQTAAAASVATYTPTADGTFEASANLLATTATSYSITITVTYTDESNTSRSVNLACQGSGSGVVTTLANANGPEYQSFPVTIRAKGGTALTVTTAGTFTTITYNVEGVIKQIA